jgi:hypothetical protein
MRRADVEFLLSRTGRLGSGTNGRTSGELTPQQRARLELAAQRASERGRLAARIKARLTRRTPKPAGRRVEQR